MSITMLEEDASLPVIGKIRLGIRKETDRGTEYPESVPHFVLHDAPEVAKAYGDKPMEFDAFFLTDDVEEAIPAWYKWYSGGKRDKAGNIVGGELQCYGTGPASKNQDGSYEPGVAYHKAKRDPVTRIVPERPCLGEKCPDFYGGNGKAQCGVAMTVKVFVPMASMYGLFTIDTKSKTSIMRFIAQVKLIKDQYGKLRGIPFKIFREPVSMPVPDKPGQRKTHYILSIKPIDHDDFVASKGAQIAQKIHNIVNSNLLGPTSASMIDAPMEDNYAMIEDAYVPTEVKVATAAEIAESKDLQGLFEELSKIAKRNNTAQGRLLTARKFEKEADPKQALKDYLELQIKNLLEAAKAASAAKPADKTVDTTVVAENKPVSEKPKADATIQAEAKVADTKPQPTGAQPVADSNGLI